MKPIVLAAALAVLIGTQAHGAPVLTPDQAQTLRDANETARQAITVAQADRRLARAERDRLLLDPTPDRRALEAAVQKETAAGARAELARIDRTLKVKGLPGQGPKAKHKPKSQAPREPQKDRHGHKKP